MIHDVVGEPRLRVDLGAGRTVSEIGSVIGDVGRIVDYAHLTIADLAFEQSTRSRRPDQFDEDARRRYQTLEDLDRVLSTYVRVVDGVLDEREAGYLLTLLGRRLDGRFVPEHLQFGVESLIVPLLRVSSGLGGASLVERFEQVDPVLFERVITGIQDARRDAAGSIEQRFRVPRPEVDRLTYENPLGLDLVQGIPPGVELGALLTAFVATLRLAFGSGPRERAEAAQIRAEIHSSTTVEVPTPSRSLLNAAENVQVYDWEIDS